MSEGTEHEDPGFIQHANYCHLQHGMGGMCNCGASARAETTTEWGVEHRSGDVCRHDTESQARGCAGGGYPGKRVVRREVTAWTEADR